MAPREHYHRPPVTADAGSRSHRDGVWRYRLAFSLVVVAIAVGAFFLIRHLVSGNSEGSPDIGHGGLRVAAPLTPRPAG